MDGNYNNPIHFVQMVRGRTRVRPTRSKLVQLYKLDSRFTKLLYIPRTYSFAKKTRGTDRDGTTPKLPPKILRTFIISTAPFFFRYAFCKGPGTGSGCMCLVPVPSLMIIIFSINHSEVGTVVDLLPVQLRTIGFSTGEIWSSLVEHVSVVHT